MAAYVHNVGSSMGLNVPGLFPDLQELFRPFGHVSRVFLAVDRETGENRGFAFVNYVHRCAYAALCVMRGCCSGAFGCRYASTCQNKLTSSTTPLLAQLCGELHMYSVLAVLHPAGKPARKVQPVLMPGPTIAGTA